MGDSPFHKRIFSEPTEDDKEAGRRWLGGGFKWLDSVVPSKQEPMVSMGCSVEPPLPCTLCGKSHPGAFEPAFPEIRRSKVRSHNQDRPMGPLSDLELLRCGGSKEQIASIVKKFAHEDVVDTMKYLAKTQEDVDRIAALRRKAVQQQRERESNPKPSIDVLGTLRWHFPQWDWKSVSHSPTSTYHPTQVLLRGVHSSLVLTLSGSWWSLHDPSAENGQWTFEIRVGLRSPTKLTRYGTGNLVTELNLFLEEAEALTGAFQNLGEPS